MAQPYSRDFGDVFQELVSKALDEDFLVGAKDNGILCDWTLEDLEEVKADEVMDDPEVRKSLEAIVKKVLVTLKKEVRAEEGVPDGDENE